MLNWQYGHPFAHHACLYPIRLAHGGMRSAPGDAFRRFKSIRSGCGGQRPGGGSGKCGRRGTSNCERWPPGAMNIIYRNKRVPRIVGYRNIGVWPAF